MLSDGKTVFVAGGSGRIHRRNCVCNVWTPIDVGAKSVYAIDRQGVSILESGASGHVYERTADGWQARETEMTADLRGVAYGDDVDVAVGLSGTIVERT